MHIPLSGSQGQLRYSLFASAAVAYTLQVTGMAVQLLPLRLQPYAYLHKKRLETEVEEEGKGWVQYCTALAMRVGEGQDRCHSALSAIPKHLSRTER